MTKAPFTNGADLQTDWVFERITDKFMNSKISTNDDCSAIFFVEDLQDFYKVSIKMFTNVITFENLTDFMVDPDLAKELFELLTEVVPNELHVEGEFDSDGKYKMMFYYKD